MPARTSTKLPKAEHDAPEWQAAAQALLLVATRGGPTMLARIGMMRALDRHEPRSTPAPRRKRAKAYRIVWVAADPVYAVGSTDDAAVEVGYVRFRR